MDGLHAVLVGWSRRMIEEFPLERYATISDDYMTDLEPSSYTQFSWAFDNFITRENPTIAGYNYLRNHFDDSELISKEVWDEDYASPNTEWHEGMTFYQADVIRDEQIYQQKLQWATPETNFPSIAGAFAASALDPLNYLPWTRLMGASVKAMTLSSRVAYNVVDAVASSAVGEVPIYLNKKATQVEYDMSTALMNVAFAGASGAALAGMTTVYKNLKNRTIEETSGAGAKALNDASEGKPIEINETAPPRPKTEAELEAEAPLEKAKRILDDEWKLLSEEETVKAVFKSGKNIAKKMVDFIQCKMR